MNLLLTAGQAAGALITIFSLFALIVKYAMVKPIKTYIDKMTWQIQPHANGGRSLPDLNDKIDKLTALLSAHIIDHDTRK